jgi:DNA-binding XRE family transcriptional regulator
MAKSSITKPARGASSAPIRGAAGPAKAAAEPRRPLHPVRGPGSEFSRNLGAAIRARRRELGLTQTQLGQPLTKGFVSEVERGRSLPSLAALVLMADRLEVPVSQLLGEVKGGLSPVYTARDENEHAPAEPRPGR